MAKIQTLKITSPSNKVSPQLCGEIDIRKIGNIGAHMECDINLIVDIEPNEAEKTFTTD